MAETPLPPPFRSRFLTLAKSCWMFKPTEYFIEMQDVHPKKMGWGSQCGGQTCHTLVSGFEKE